MFLVHVQIIEIEDSKMEKTPVTFTSGCAISKDNFYVSAAIDDLDSWDAFSRIFIYRYGNETNWSSHDLDGWKVVSVAYQMMMNERSLISLDKDGNVEVFQQIEEIYQQVNPFKKEQYIYGQFNKLRTVRQELYACGNGGQVYLNAGDSWSNVGFNLEEQPLEVKQGEIFSLDSDFSFERNLYDINGFAHDHLYVCGTKGDDGFIAFFNGSNWIEVNRITPSALYSITLCPDGKSVLISGQYGTLLKGNIDDGFKNLKNISINSTFYNAAFYQEAIYIASEQGLYIYADSEYSIVPELSDIQGVISVEEKDGILWVLSYKQLIRFDGKTWDKINHPDNDEIQYSQLKCRVGDVCPRSGDWWSPAINMEKRYFDQGETMPEIPNNPWGETIWYLDIESND